MQPIYSHPPALGFQINPFDNKGNAKKEYSSGKDDDGDDIILDKGWHNAGSYYVQFSKASSEKKLYKKIRNSNYSKIAGYFPVIGTLIGAGRIIVTIKDKNLPIKNKVAHILRGTVEFLNLGVLLLIPDLILSNCRDFHSKLAPANDFSYLPVPTLSPFDNPEGLRGNDTWETDRRPSIDDSETNI